jgi:hypothetical protein
MSHRVTTVSTSPPSLKSVTIKMLIPRWKWMVIARGRMADIEKVYYATGLWRELMSLTALPLCTVSFVRIKM